MKEKISLNLNNKNAVVTGAAGEIGRTIAEVMAIAGCNVILIDLEMQMSILQELSERLKTKYSVNTSCKATDIRNASEVKALADALENEFSNIDILINNVGVNQLVPALQVKEEDWDTILDTNLKGTFLMCQSIGRLMVKAREGSIVNIASQHGIVGNNLRAPYCASKAGVINLTRELALEWAKYNIRVNCVSPTYVINEKNKTMLSDNINFKKTLTSIPMGRYCTPLDVAQSVLFLSGPLASLVTGHNLVVDGGYTIR